MPGLTPQERRLIEQRQSDEAERLKYEKDAKEQERIKNRNAKSAIRNRQRPQPKIIIYTNLLFISPLGKQKSSQWAIILLYPMKKSITISHIYWSVGNIKFADNILSLGLKIKTTKSNGPNFNTYILDDKTKIIAFVEKNREIKIYDSCLRLFAPPKTIISAHKIFQKFKYTCHLTKSEKSNLITLSCFAPTPNSFCEINISNLR